ncbi:MAG TPA: hypothetical protein PK642_06795 [Paludibacteraceae bacterium]|nr:hypothetical protein [Paludibacteraceae bacterium]
MKETNRNIFFLPYPYKPIGYFLIVAGIIWWFVSQYVGIVIKIPFFAVVSSFVSTKFFTIVKTNFTDEIAFITALLGCIFSVFSKEKNENSQVNIIRYDSIFLALLIDLFLLLFSTIFLYGSAFIAIVLVNIVLLPIIYLILVKIQLHKINRSNLKNNKIKS